MESSFEVLNDEDASPSIQDKVSDLQECLMNVTTGQMQTKKEVRGNISETKFSCFLCKKITTDVVPHQDSRASEAFRTQFCSDCCASKPNIALLKKTLTDSDRFVSNLIEAYDEPLAMNIRNSSNPDNVHVNKKTLNSQALLYCCITCLMQNISVKDLSNHRQCMVMAQTKKINTTGTDHNYNKKKPRIMNYLLKQQETCIHIKCLMNSENQPEAYSCSICCSDSQMMSEPCEHVKLLTDSVLLDELVGNKPSKHRHSLPSNQEPNIGMLLTDSVLLGEMVGNKPSKHRYSLSSKQEPNIGNSLVRKKTRYMCVSCGKLYSKQSSLVQHMQVHSVEPSPCPHCSKVFMSGAMLKAHLNVHDVFPYKCSQCSQTFLLEPLLKKHLSAEHNSKPRASDGTFKCNHCTKSFTLQSNLDIHLKSHDYSCTLCGKNFVTRTALKSHNKCHSQKGVRARIPQVCEQCGVEMCDLGALRKHQARQHGTERDKNFVCETCGAAFWQKVELDLHQTIHSEDRPFTCDVCNATFKRKRYVATHFERVHSIFNDSLLDPCITCGMKFNTKKHKLEHLKTHSNLSHICKICNKSLSSKIGLYLHNKYAHERNSGSLSNNSALKSVVRKAKQNRREVVEGSLFSCNMCDKTYSTNGSLYQHRRNVHLNREYPCNVCGKVYTKSVSLYAHKYTHAKEGLACPICSKVFHWQGSLRQHINTHSDVKKHHCKYCEKKFHRKYLLDTHTRTHTGEKPYACAVCGRSFAQTGDRNKHQMRHNRI